MNPANKAMLALILPPSQNGYHECVAVMLDHFPELVQHMILLVFSEEVTEVKMLEDMEFLCKSSTRLLSRVVWSLAEKVADRGMELLR